VRLFFNRTTQIVIDLVVLSAALWAAHYLRFDGDPPALYSGRLLVVWPYIVALQYLCLRACGVHRFQWRYVGLREVTRIFVAVGIAASVVLAMRFVSGELARYEPVFKTLFVPTGIALIDFAFAFLAITGVRVARRLLAEHADERRRAAGAGKELERIILIGAGQAGLLVAKELAGRPDLGLKPVGFLDDDPQKQGTVLHGLRVLGTTKDLARVCGEKGIDQALIAIASAPGKDIRRIAELCRRHEIATKIVPGIYEIVGGKVNLSRIRDVEIEDLLGREPVCLDLEALRAQLTGKVVLVTGAGGSIGSELCRQVGHFEPARLVLLEQAENALFHIHRELEALFPGMPLSPCVADVCDAERVRAVMDEFRPEVVFHAAAHKHVPMMEWNPGEAVKNNVLGTRTLADAADRAGVAAFVMISTDKAVNPTSVMGATKRAAEIYAQSLARRSRTRFVTVRFGNVLGSAGSVIPLFKEQIARGGPVKVTHPDMKRYFMTIPEACQLVMQAGTMGRGGEIFILDMGQPVKIVDLARDMIQLSGLLPDEDIEIQFTGCRPGEKLFEELAVDGEHAGKTTHPKIFVGRARDFEADEVEAWLGRLAKAAAGGERDAIRAELRGLIPEFGAPDEAPVPVKPPVKRRSEGMPVFGRRTPPVGVPRQPGTASAAISRLGTEPG
jgi:FlaA1/EpsC-like NDP-sugar epimerase